MHQEYLLGWGTLALITAGIAQGKNRSGLGWFFLSAIFGPLALFVLLFCGKLPEPGVYSIVGPSEESDAP